MTRLTILSEACADCPFKGRFPHLRSGRIREIMEETTEGVGSYFVCHKTVDYGDNGEEGGNGADAVFGPAAVCAGWKEAVETIGRVPQVIQVAERLGLTEVVPPYETEDA